MDSPTEEGFDSVQWGNASQPDDRSADPAPHSTGKARQTQADGADEVHLPPDRNADQVDVAGIGPEGYLECTVDKPQKENDGTKDAYVSYLITTHSDFKTFSRNDFTVRRRFTDFVFLYKQLFRQYTHIAVPPLPEKHKMEYVRGDRFGSDFTQRRAHALHRFIRRITLHPVLRRNITFLNFLETPDWNSTMRSRNLRATSLSAEGAPAGSGPGAGTSTSAFESFQDWSINLFTKPHKPDKRFTDVKEKADKLDEDLGHVEKVVARVARREADLEADYTDLATQSRRLVAMEPGVAPTLTAFAAGVDATASGMRGLRDATDQAYLGSLRDMSSYVGALKALLRLREQKQVDFEALTEYLAKAAAERDLLASQAAGRSGSLQGGASGFLRSKLEDVRGVDHEQARRERLRRTELQIERLTREVDGAKTTSEAFDEQVVAEVAEFERIKACEFRDTLGALAGAEMAFWSGTIDTWEGFLADVESGAGGESESGDGEGRLSSAATLAG